MDGIRPSLNFIFLIMLRFNDCPRIEIRVYLFINIHIDNYILIIKSSGLRRSNMRSRGSLDYYIAPYRICRLYNNIFIDSSNWLYLLLLIGLRYYS